MDHAGTEAGNSRIDELISSRTRRECLSALFGGLCGGCRIIETSMDESNCSGANEGQLSLARSHTVIT